MRYLYTFLLYLALPFIFLRLLWRSRKLPAYRHRWLERLGFFPQKLDKCIWVHAVSLGETIAAIPLIKALKIKYPHYPLVITNMTPTGSARVKEVFGNTVHNAYLPYDTPTAVSRFLERARPHLLIVIETELWPNLFAACKAASIGVVVTNARLSEKSAQNYQKVLPLTREMFKAVTALAVQTQVEADRFIALGMPRERIQVTGSLKFDLELPAELPKKSAMLREQLGDRLIWIAGSTHPGEDEIMLAAHRLIREKFPNALLILVPRHLDRFDSVAELIKKYQFSLARRSEETTVNPDTAVFLGDTVGEMLLMYSVSDVACVAGSFAAIGGHNMIEPAALHKPVITGPHLFNFTEISNQLLNAEGMVKVENAEQLAQIVIKLFADESYRQQMGENAYSIVEKNRGSLKKQLNLIMLSTW